jgi:hypothetical protein
MWSHSYAKVSFTNLVLLWFRAFFEQTKRLKHVHFYLSDDVLSSYERMRAALNGVIAAGGGDPGETFASGGFIMMLRALSDAKATVEYIDGDRLSWKVLKSRTLLRDLKPPFTTDLSKLHLEFYFGSDDDGDQPREFLMRTKALNDFLAQFPNLTVLNIGVVDFYAEHGQPDAIHFDDITTDSKAWPHLKELHLSYIACGQTELILFFEDHSTTLEAIHFRDIYLVGMSDSWPALLRKARRSLKSLKRSSMHGFLSSASGSPWWLDDDRSLPERIERYLLYGGRLPLPLGDMDDKLDICDVEDESIMDLWTPIPGMDMDMKDDGNEFNNLS